MTTKALLRTTREGQFDVARDQLRARVAEHLSFGDTAVEVTVEPLLRRGETGDLEQSIRISSDVRLTAAEVRDLSGESVLRGIEEVAGGVRVFVPEYAEETKVSLLLPEVDETVAVSLVVGAVRHWDIHLVHHTHLDIGYTDPQGRVIAEHLSYLDSALRLVKETSSLDDDAQFRWAVESLWSFEQWAANRPRAVVEDFLDHVRAGRIELTAMPFNLHTESCSTDELHELLRTANRLRDEEQVPIVAAMQTDVPGSVTGLVEALAGNDVRYLSVAHNWAGRSVPHLTGGQDLPRLFWWSSPAGQRVLVWVTDSPHGLAYMEGPMLGFDVSYELVEDSLPSYLLAMATRPYPFDDGSFDIYWGPEPLHRTPYEHDLLHLRVQGHFADNAPPRRIMSETVQRWNERWAFPHLRLSTNAEFFAAAEERVGDSIPTLTGDWNNWWADGVGSGARPVQLVRKAQATLADVQTISALDRLMGQPEDCDDSADIASVYLNMALFDEHTWGSAVPWGHSDDHMESGDDQWHWKFHKALQAYDDSRTLKGRVKARLAQRLGVANDAVASVYVLNPTSHGRNGVVRVFLAESQVPLHTNLAAVDARTGSPVPLASWPQVHEPHREAGRYIDLALGDVPSVGMVRVDLVQTEEPIAAPTVAESGEAVLENEYLRVEVDLAHACIRSITYKPRDLELVERGSTFGFNAYVYDTFGSGGREVHMSGQLVGDDKLALMGERTLARVAGLVERGSDAVRSWLTYETSGRGAESIRTTISLEHGSDRLDIENRVAKQATMYKESGYFAFPFVGDGASVIRHEVTGAVAGTDLEQVPGGAQHMRAIRRWIAIQSGDVGIAWVTQDAPLVQIADIALPYAPFPTTAPRREPTTIYSWIHNNVWDTNYQPAQGFEMTFKYSVSATTAGTPEGATAFAAETAENVTRRLSGVLAERRSPDAEVPTEFAGVTVSDDRVRVVGLTTPAPGTVLVRLQSVAESNLRVDLSVGAGLCCARAANLLGSPGEEIPVAGGVVSLEVPALGTAGCLLKLEASR